MYACLAAELTGPLCKLQSEEGLGLLAFFSGRGGEEAEKKEPELGPTWKTPQIAFDIYIKFKVHVLHFNRNVQIKGV